MGNGAIPDSCTPTRCRSCPDLDICIAPKIQPPVAQASQVVSAPAVAISAGTGGMRSAIRTSEERMRSLPARATCNEMKCNVCVGRDFCRK